MHLLCRSKNFWKAPWKSSCVSASMTIVTPSFFSTIVSWRQPLSLANDQKSQGTRSRLYGGWGTVNAHLGQIVYDKDGVVEWWIVLVEMLLTRFEECWSLPMEFLQTLTLWPINSGVLISLLLPHLSSSLRDALPSLNILCHSKTDARFMQDAPKAVWSIPCVFVAFFPSLKQNFIAYSSSKVFSRQDCIFEIHLLWQSGFSRVYSNSCCNCSFEPEILKIS